MRVLRSLLTVLVVLCVLFVVVDRVAVELAESEAASRVRETPGFTADPEISIQGFPFLTQVAAGRLESVRASAENARAGSGEVSLRIARLTAEVSGVRLADDFASAVADTASGTALISYADLSEVVPEGISVSYAGKDKSTGAGKVKVAFRLSLLGQSIQGDVVSVVRLKDETISLRATSIPRIPGFEDLIRDRIDFSQRVTGLPSGIELEDLSVAPEGVTVSLNGTDVVLAG